MRGVDCEACYQRDCDCECRTCEAARELQRQIATVARDTIVMLKNTQIVGDFSNQPRLKLRR